MPAIEPTQPANNPYEYTLPYYGLPDIPPPPPPMKKKHHTFLWIVFGLLLVLILASMSFIGVQQYERSSSNARTAVPTTLPTQPTMQPASQPTKNVSYTAQSIIADFQTHGLPTDNLSYGMTLNQFLGNGDINVDEQSSAEFVDPSFCTGPCGAGSVWMGVYPTANDAEIAEKDIAAYVAWQSQIPGPGLGAASVSNQFGRCIMLGEALTSAYVQIIKQDCT